MYYNSKCIPKKLDFGFYGIIFSEKVLCWGKKLHKKKLIIVAGGLASKSVMIKYKSIFKYIIFWNYKLFESINFELSDRIIIESSNAKNFLNLKRYSKKIKILNMYVDIDNFKIYKKYQERENIIGYIGRLSEEKGIFTSIEWFLDRKEIHLQPEFSDTL